MTIRITQGMLYSRALADVQRGLRRYSQLQQQVATGRRINRPSDDPAAALRILPLRNELRELDQLKDNVNLARETLDTGAAAMEDASGLMQRLRELTTQASNGTLSVEDRESIAAEVDQMLGQLVSIGNSRRGDRYLFGGTASSSAPFELQNTASGSRVVYHGNHDTLDIEVAPGVTTSLNLPGDGVFLSRNRGSTVFSALPGQFPTGAASAGGGDTGVGYGELQVTYTGLHTNAPSTVSAGNGTTNAIGDLSFAFTSAPDTLSVGGGPALNLPITDGDFTTGDGRRISLTVTGVPATTSGTFTAKAGLSTDGGQTVQEVTSFADVATVRHSETGEVLNVDVTALARTGADQVKYEGTFDAFTTLISLRDLLRNDDGLDPELARSRIAEMLAEVDGSHNSVLDGLRELGFRSSSMDNLSNRVEGLSISRQESLSRVQDTDIAEAIVELQAQDLAYQAALQVTSRVIQTSLSGLLR